MNAKRPHEIRLELARGHIELGELDTALACLERAAADAPDPTILLTALEDLASACDAVPGSPTEGVRLLHRKIRAAAPPRPAPVPSQPQARPVPLPRPVGAPRAPAFVELAPPPREGPSRSQRQIESLQSWLARVRQRFGGEGAHDVP